MLQTKNLLLKDYSMDNLEKLNEWNNDPELLYLNDDRPEPFVPVPLEHTRKYLERVLSVKNEDIQRFAIHKKADNSYIGYCMLAFIDNYHKSCKFGITIGERSEWGKGYGKEVLEEIVRYCFEELEMNRVGAEVYAFNERSIRTFEGAGFKREGVVRQAVFKGGGFVDEYQYGILKEEWKKDR